MLLERHGNAEVVIDPDGADLTGYRLVIYGVVVVFRVWLNFAARVVFPNNMGR